MFKRIFAFLALAFTLFGTQCWAQSPTSNCVPPEEGSTQACMFIAGTNSSVIATFDCPSAQTPCPDPGAHSIKFTVGMVSTSFTIFVTPHKVTGDGLCDSGMPGGIDSEPGTSL